MVVTFTANPQPESGILWIGNTRLSYFKSSSFNPGDEEGEYEVTLDFNGMKKEQEGEENIILSVKNRLGTTNFTLFKSGVISEGIFDLVQSPRNHFP